MIRLKPLVYAPMSEMFGRRPIYVISMGLYTGISRSRQLIRCGAQDRDAVFMIPSAVAKNSATLLVGRVLAGLAASAPMTNVSRIGLRSYHAKQLIAPLFRSVGGMYN